jgi:hypothetical protein
VLVEADIGFLEDCLADYRGLWEVAWMEPDVPVAERAIFTKGLVEKGLLDLQRVPDWGGMGATAPLPREEAISIVAQPENYAAPGEGHSGFYVLTITPAGEDAIAEWYSARSTGASV